MINIGIECESIEKKEWGIGRIVSRLLQDISSRPQLKKDFRFHLFFKTSIPNFDYLNDDIFVKKIIKLPYQRSTSFSLYYYLFLPIYLWFYKVDVMFFPNYMLPHLFFGTSIVHMTNDIYFEMKSKSQKFRHKIAYRIFTGWATKHATRLLTWSYSAKNDISKLFHIASDKIEVAYLGLDLPNTFDSPNINGDYIFYLGQAFPRRHLKETILAFEQISNDYPKLSLIASGVDKYKPPIIKKMANELNRKLGREAIKYYDFIKDDSQIAHLYKHAKLFVYISDKESFGLPPLEALSFGSIPVVADNDLSHELFGDNAFFVSKLHDVDSIAVAFKEGLTNESKRIEIAKSAFSLKSKFSWENYTNIFLQICRELA
ncbi:MAG: glycosyltransferase [bacterium]|nr:glycosyltransferase [bacterium]